MTGDPLLVLAQHCRNRTATQQCLSAELRRLVGTCQDLADHGEADAKRYEGIVARVERMADVSVVERLAGGRETLAANVPNGAMCFET